jgi:cobalamin biosynthesis Mg chelatase CobN
MPSAGAWARGQLAANEILKQHRAANNGEYPETIAVTLWGLDAIKTRGTLSEDLAVSCFLFAPSLYRLLDSFER